MEGQGSREGSAGEEVGPEGSEGFDAMVEAIEEAERRQRLRGGLYALAAMLVVGVAVWSWMTYREDLYVPKVDLEEANQSTWERTNDPQCRGFIEEVGRIGEEFREYEDTIEGTLMSSDEEQIEELMGWFERMRGRLERAEASSAEANFRYEQSPRELGDWFDSVYRVMSYFEKLGEERLASLRGEDEGGVLVEGPGVGEEPAEREPLEDRVAAGLLSMNDGFQSFRVWHRASAHPCGAAEPGETPWRADEGSQGTQVDAR